MTAKPAIDDGDVRIWLGDVIDGLRAMPDELAQTCVTSPPYWGLRDYGADGQIGLEQTPDEYVARMVGVFREVRRVLRDDGTLWLNLGDSYATGGMSNPSPASTLGDGKDRGAAEYKIARTRPVALKHKDLVGIPWRVAFALQADGWYLRSDIIWSKPNPMPESVTDRPTKSHEYVFLLSKSARYLYDHEAIREPLVSTPEQYLRAGKSVRENHQYGEVAGRPLGPSSFASVPDGRNARSVWQIATKPYAEAHFATFPTELPERCIKAGSRGPGKRCDCDEIINTPTGTRQQDDPSMITGRAGMNRPRNNGEGTRPITRREQRAYAEQLRNTSHREQMEREAGSAFAHYIRTDASGARPVPQNLLDTWLSRGWITDPEPCKHKVEQGDTVLDPFMGSGTTAWVARHLGRRAVGCELNPDYIKIAARRLQQLSLLGS